MLALPENIWLLPLVAALAAGALAASVVQLQKNYRFGQDSRIFHLSHAINEGRVEEALQILRSAYSVGARGKEPRTHSRRRRGAATGRSGPS